MLLLLAAGLGFSTAQAQYFGLKAGANAAVLDGEKLTTQTDYRVSYHAGAFYNYNLIGPLSLRPELLYSLQGGEFKSGQEDFETKLHYLNLPILADLKIGPVHLQAGPQFGLLLTAKESGLLLTGYNPVGNQPQYTNVNRQVTDQYKKQDFSLCAGLELDLGQSFALGGRLTAGLTDVDDYDQVRSVDDPRLKNRVFQAYAVLKLGK